MKVLTRNDTRDLRQFGLLMAAAFPVVFMVILPWLISHPQPLWPAVVSAVFLVAATIVPRWLYPVYVGWMRVARVLGWINTRILLGVIFFLLMLPLGRAARALGKLQYAGGPDKSRSSYRTTRDHRPDFNDLENPF